MKNLYEIAGACERDLAAIGIKIGWVTGYKANSRAKRRLGLCSSNGCGGFEIQVSYVLLRDEVPMDELRNTLFHELLHTCKGCQNHGKEWKRLAQKVSVAYNMDITRCASPDEKSVHILQDQRKDEAKYKFQCQGCGKIHINMRASGFTRQPERYRCGRCGTLGKWTKLQ